MFPAKILGRRVCKRYAGGLRVTKTEAAQRIRRKGKPAEQRMKIINDI